MPLKMEICPRHLKDKKHNFHSISSQKKQKMIQVTNQPSVMQNDGLVCCSFAFLTTSYKNTKILEVLQIIIKYKDK